MLIKYLFMFSLLCILPDSHARAQQPSLPATPMAYPNLSAPLALRWRFPNERISGLTPALWQNNIYLPLANGELVALRADDGQLLWKSELGGKFTAAPFADARAVYVFSTTYVNDTHSASKETKETATGAPPSKDSFVKSDGAPHKSEDTGFVRALAGASGVTLWTHMLPMPLTRTLAADESNLYGAAANGIIYSLRKTDGEIVWRTPLANSLISNPFLSGGVIYILDSQGTIYALNSASGHTLWRYQTRPATRASVVVDRGIVFSGASDGRVFAVRATDGKKMWSARVGGGVMALAPTNEGLLVASLDDFAYMLSARKGDRIWKTQLAGRIEAQPLVTDTAALFAPLSGDACVVLSLRDGKPANSLPVGEENNTAANPLLTADRLFITTRHGLLAFAANGESQSETAQRATPTLPAKQ